MIGRLIKRVGDWVTRHERCSIYYSELPPPDDDSKHRWKYPLDFPRAFSLPPLPFGPNVLSRRWRL